MLNVVALVAATVTGPAILLLWSLIYTTACWSLALPAVVMIVLMLAIREGALRRRRCLADCWFSQGSALHRLVSSATLITLIALVISSAFTAVLMASIPSWDFEVLALLALDSLAITALYFIFHRAATNVLRVNRGFRALFARHWTVAVNVPVMVVALLSIQLQQSPPDYLDQSLQLGPSLEAASVSVSSACPVVDRLARLGQESEAFSWWFTLKVTRAIEDERVRWVAWIAFLVSGTLTLWAYSRFCVQLVYYAHRKAGEA
ncbi:MAG: hypothetical protein OEN52_10265 [Gammaproteobacteria bacterium]|nr:hypothetical protein [Gammaproteobacteria bacterium]MDH3561321.1 hypothetical protein [Gammaproteobacteria bacterium]